MDPVYYIVIGIVLWLVYLTFQNSSILARLNKQADTEGRIGPRGLTGPQGLQGDPGETGLTGAQGETGAAGVDWKKKGKS